MHLFFHVKFTEAKHYHAKLVNIRKEMLMLHEKTSKLKVSWKFFHILCKGGDLIVCFSLVFIFWLLIFPCKITYFVHGTLFSFKAYFFEPSLCFLLTTGLVSSYSLTMSLQFSLNKNLEEQIFLYQRDLKLPRMNLKITYEIYS